MQNAPTAPRRPLRQNGEVLFLFLFSLIAAFLFQLICSKSSPLYPMNDWVDVQCFSTVGRSLLDGKVLYRDIYEQKGPLVYFVYAFANLISRNSMLGVFLFYVLFMALHLFFTCKIACLFGSRAQALCLTALLALLTHVLPSFVHGGSVEEMCLWILSCALWIVLRTIKENRFFSTGACIGLGALAGVIFLFKFTFAGFFLGLVLFTAIWYIQKKEYRRLALSAAAFLLGFAAAVLPVLLYFYVHRALPDFFTAYFYNNIFLYSGAKEKAGLASRRIQLLILGFAVLILFRKKLFPRADKKLVYAPLCCLFLLCIGTYWSSSYPYYDLILYPFAPLLFIPLMHRLPRLPKALPAIILAAGVLLSYPLSSNTYLMKYAQEELPPYIFARHIREVENPTLLNYGILDGGFYRAADVTPTAKYFCTLNIPLPQMEEEHRQLMAEGRVQFVVCEEELNNLPHYTLVDTASFPFEGRDHIYYLYRCEIAP